MPLVLSNSLTRNKEPFESVVPGTVGIYFCGPTVYSDPHLGHARGPVVIDTLRRWFERSGYRVRLVSNITDVGHLTDDGDDGEDKMLKRAALERLEPMEVAEKYFWTYYDAMDALGVRRPSIVPRASGHITEQIALTEELIERGLAYERRGSVYFDVSAWADYGELSGRDLDDAVEGTRVEVRDDKDDPRDFALWKCAQEGHIMRWRSPWGEGFPGWHIECSVMSTKYLGDEFDIHGGGLDLMFPHHEAEIAQARGAGKPFARVWLHWNMITLGGEKMSKSKSHFVTLAELLERYEGAVVRFHLLRSHYRSVSDFSDDGLTGSEQGLKRLRDAVAAGQALAGDTAADPDAYADHERSFAAAMDDDINTPQAIAALFDAARDLNRDVASGHAARAAAGVALITGLLEGVLGVAATQGATDDDELLGRVVTLLLQERDAARIARDFARSDAIRDRLAELGIAVEDTADGSRWKRG
jgi:cysteinyl-tRNA synthetase